MNLPGCIAELCIFHDLVGSRVTCRPPPLNTDQDVLCYVSEKDADELLAQLEGEGWIFDGNAAYANSVEQGIGFRSYRSGELNLVITSEFNFYNRFMAATSIAAHLNLMKKDDRVALFQAVLYGNPYVDPNPFNLTLAA